MSRPVAATTANAVSTVSVPTTATGSTAMGVFARIRAVSAVEAVSQECAPERRSRDQASVPPGFGPATAWGRTRCALVLGEQLTPWQRVLILTDSSSGLSMAADPRRYPAINPDLHVVLHRDPVGDWIGIDAHTHTVPGHGSAAYARVSDAAGIVGTSTQTLYASTAV